MIEESDATIIELVLGGQFDRFAAPYDFRCHGGVCRLSRVVGR